MTDEAIPQFRAAMGAAGFTPPAAVVDDGKIRRFAVENDRGGQRSGWYRIYPDFPYNGRFGNWKTGEVHDWRAQPDQSLPAVEREDWRRRVEEQRAARELAAKREAERVSARAQRRWDSAEPASPDHRYLVRKRVGVHGIRQAGDKLLVPVRDASGMLHGDQAINSEGVKRFMAGTSKAGNYHSIGRPRGVLVIVEGYATGATIHEATGHAVAVAFDAGNLRPVAERLRAKYPEMHIIIAGDNDRSTPGNPGRTAAEAAARAVGGVALLPVFDDADEGTDWNDYAGLYGLDGVALEFASAENTEASALPSLDPSDVEDVPPPPEPEPSPRPRFRLISDTEMEDLPAPEPLVGDKLTRGGFAALVGPPGDGKTFLALAWAASVATGVPCCGEPVHAGPVVYVAAEGSSGLGSRIKAWKVANHQYGALGIYFVTEPVALLNAAEVGHFLGALEQLPAPPALVVLDTLARCMVGGDENSTQDMSAFIAGADQIRRETGAAVLILHHMNAGGERERGNTALRGACDTLMFLKAEGDVLTLTCEKQKDAAPFTKARLRLVPVLESCVVSTAEGGSHAAEQELTARHIEVLALLQSHFLAHGATTSEWLKASGLPERTFYRTRTMLVGRGLVHAPDQPRGGRYTLAPDGEALLGSSTYYPKAA